ncbi:hypothetical protein ACFVX6_19760 [Streptomyces sp. NPDC058289]|uniref:hypothetical protein n=1 Tax=Streptomyces sp. NPDC058289 TaxID=3346425 RepID=UPI0036E579CD
MPLLWPAHEEGRIPERLATLLDARARFAERVAAVVEFEPPPEREQRVRKAEATTANLRAARVRLAGQRGADPELRPTAIKGRVARPAPERPNRGAPAQGWFQPNA